MCNVTLQVPPPLDLQPEELFASTEVALQPLDTGVGPYQRAAACVTYVGVPVCMMSTHAWGQNPHPPTHLITHTHPPNHARTRAPRNTLTDSSVVHAMPGMRWVSPSAVLMLSCTPSV